MWESIAAPLVIGALLAAFGNWLTRGGRRWRALTTARHELEVAQLLIAHNSEQAALLHAKASDGVGRYLAPRAFESAESKAEAVASASATVVVLTVLVLIADDIGDASWLEQVGLGTALAIVWHLIRASAHLLLRWTRRRRLKRAAADLQG
jgi:hypothetical protein